MQPLSPRQQNLFDEHLNWAVNIARNIARKMPSAFDPEDLIQAARIGLWKAVQKFNPNLGIPFQGCAYLYVRGEIMMHVRRRNWKEAMHDELNIAYPDTRPLPDGQLKIQADELADERRLLLIKSLTALLPTPQCEAVRGILEGTSPDDLAVAMKLSRPRLHVTLNAAAARLRNTQPRLAEPPKIQRPRPSSPAFVPVRPPLRAASTSEQRVLSEAEQEKKAFCTKGRMEWRSDLAP